MDLEKIWKKIKNKPHVIGYSKKMRKRIKNGKEIDEDVMRVYVTHKRPIHVLHADEVIPNEIDGVKVDIVEVGVLKKLSSNTYKTQVVRPLVGGISIGNVDITAGTLGYFVQDNKNNIYLASNAHVFTDDPSKKKPRHVEIVQPGVYDKGTQVVATYTWHQRLIPDSCLHKGTNYIDFAVAEPLVSYEVKEIDLDVSGLKFVGFGFAGSSLSSVVCKVKYIVEAGYTPVNTQTTEVNIGDILHKTGRTSCHNTSTVIDDSAVVTVNYDTYDVTFNDIILTTPFMEPGDSGSAVWK